jgi:hypothetical protein
MLEGKARAHPSEASLRLAMGGFMALSTNILDRAEKLASDDHEPFSLLRKVVNFVRKKFYNIGHLALAFLLNITVLL